MPTRWVPDATTNCTNLVQLTNKFGGMAGHSGEGTASYPLCTKQSDNEDTQVDSGGVVPISERDQGSMNEFENITSGTAK